MIEFDASFSCSTSVLMSIKLSWSPCGTWRHITHSHTPTGSSLSKPTHWSCYQTIQSEHLIIGYVFLGFGLRVHVSQHFELGLSCLFLSVKFSVTTVVVCLNSVWLSSIVRLLSLLDAFTSFSSSLSHWSSSFSSSRPSGCSESVATWVLSGRIVVSKSSRKDSESSVWFCVLLTEASRNLLGNTTLPALLRAFDT